MCKYPPPPDYVTIGVMCVLYVFPEALNLLSIKLCFHTIL